MLTASSNFGPDADCLLRRVLLTLFAEYSDPETINQFLACQRVGACPASAVPQRCTRRPQARRSACWFAGLPLPSSALCPQPSWAGCRVSWGLRLPMVLTRRTTRKDTARQPEESSSTPTKRSKIELQLHLQRIIALRSPGYGLTCMTKPRSSVRSDVQASRHTGQGRTATRKDGGRDRPHHFEGLMRRPSTQWQLQQLSAQQPQTVS